MPHFARQSPGWLRAILWAVAISLGGCRPHRTATIPTWPEVTLRPTDRVLILAPHPDDEVLGCAGIIQQAVAMGVPVRVVVFTYGDNNQWSFTIYRKHPVVMPKSIQRMGLLRHDEAVAAGRILGLLPEQLTFLGYPDFGTLAIWDARWGDQPPYRSMLTRVTAVPYPNALRPGAPYKGEEVLRDLTTVLREFHPTKVFVSHPADHMPDHRALYLFTRVALWEVEHEMQPECYPYLVHFKRWPHPKGYDPDTPLEPPRPFEHQVRWQEYRLSPKQLDVKRVALKAHRTQYGYSARYLLSFVRANELFGDFPIVRLQPTASAISLSSKPLSHPMEAPEELTEEERAAFVGVQWERMQLVGQQLVLSTQFSRPLAKAVAVSMFVFGYRADRPFAAMPKLHIRCDALGHAVYDQTQRLPSDRITVTRAPTKLTVHIPLEVLGHPTRVLTEVRSYLGEVPLDWASWQTVELPGSS